MGTFLIQTMFKDLLRNINLLVWNKWNQWDLSLEFSLSDTTTFVSDAIHFTWATLSTDISLSTGATLGNTHYSA